MQMGFAGILRKTWKSYFFTGACLVCLSCSEEAQNVTANPCVGVKCSGVGYCAAFGDDPVCVCDEGYHAEGLNCISDEDPCEGVTCSGFGTCAVSKGKPVCICDDEYHAEGLSCISDEDPCEGVTCSGYGFCTVFDEKPLCVCDDEHVEDGLTCVDCVDGMRLSCGTDLGACRLGFHTCVNGSWSDLCHGGVQPLPDDSLCNGIDDDCDGDVDEDVEGLCIIHEFLDGQVRVLQKRTIVEEAAVEEHVNFPWAYRFSNGVIWLSYSVGRHTVDERVQWLLSSDGGFTWLEASSGQYPQGICVLEMPDTSILGLARFDREYSTEHPLNVRRWAHPDSVRTEEITSVAFPFESQFFVHRSLIRHRNSLLATFYARMAGPSNYFFSGVLRSTDEGNSWNFLSRISDEEFDSNAGYTEPAMVELQDGNLLVLMRKNEHNFLGPLAQSKSDDGGASWTPPTVIVDHGVDPMVIKLSSGALVASSGRPGVYLLVDFTGTGDHWHRIDIFQGTGCSYTSLIELAPNRVMLFYTNSGFSGTDLPEYALPNRMEAMVFEVVPSQ